MSNLSENTKAKRKTLKFSKPRYLFDTLVNSNFIQKFSLIKVMQ